MYTQDNNNSPWNPPFGREQQREIVVQVKDEFGKKGTMILPEGGYFPQPGDDFNNGIVKGTVTDSWMN